MWRAAIVLSPEVIVLFRTSLYHLIYHHSFHTIVSNWIIKNIFSLYQNNKKHLSYKIEIQSVFRLFIASHHESIIALLQKGMCTELYAMILERAFFWQLATFFEFLSTTPLHSHRIYLFYCYFSTSQPLSFVITLEKVISAIFDRSFCGSLCNIR